MVRPAGITADTTIEEIWDGFYKLVLNDDVEVGSDDYEEAKAFFMTGALTALLWVKVAVQGITPQTGLLMDQRFIEVEGLVQSFLTKRQAEQMIN
jgi:hypothetical protein